MWFKLTTEWQLRLKKNVSWQVVQIALMFAIANYLLYQLSTKVDWATSVQET